MSTSRLWASVEHAVPEGEAGSTSSSDGVDVELWTLNGNAGGGGLVNDLVSAVEARHVGRGPSDVKASRQPGPDQDSWTYPMIGALSFSSQLVRA
jgi:hypothetical protein